VFANPQEHSLPTVVHCHPPLAIPSNNGYYSGMEEHVLVVSTQIFHALGYFQGFCTDVDRYRDVLLDANNVQFRPRNEVEVDPNFKQLIPYMIFCHTDTSGHISIFQYVRGKGMGESRLHQKRSIGIGGHIAAEDQRQHSEDIYREGMLRELHEEVILHTTFTEQCVGLINDDSTEVGRVHLGIVHCLNVTEPNIISNETDLLESGFMPLNELKKHREQMESWSAISLDALFRAY
jgi:predicted NUDIX family phosphoesterase